jgi:hypothetical protein
MIGEQISIGQRVVMVKDMYPVAGIITDMDEETCNFVADLDGKLYENVPNDKFVVDGNGVTEVG